MITSGDLPEYAAEQFGKVHVDRWIHLGLADAFDGVLNRVFDGVDLARAVVEIVKAGVERGGLARGRGTR